MQAEKEFIITREQLLAAYVAPIPQKVFDAVCSRPYTVVSERDMVLDVVLKHIEDAHELLFNSMLGVDEVEVKKLKRVSELLLASKLKLRQQQVGEQG